MIKNKIIIIVLIILGLAFIILSLLGRQVKLEKNTNLNKPIENDLKEALYYASLSPSSHNTQCWRASIDTDKKEIEVFIDKERGLNVVDPSNRETYISVGAFIETLNKSLNAYGYETNIVIESDSEALLAATLSYKKTNNTIDSKLISTIEKRHTDKGKFNTTPISNEIKEKLISNQDNISFFAKDSNSFNYLKNSTIEAFTKQSNTKDKRDELASWLRFSNEETLTKKDGLPAEQLGITGIKKTFYYLFSNRETSKGDTFANQGISTNKTQVENCSDFIVITGENSRKSLLETGMVMQNLWLNATENNIAIQPMSQVLEETPYKNEVQEKLNSKEPVQVILRAGTINNYGENKKIRRNLSEFITVK